MIIVTGGAGFIGSALVWRLNTRGFDDILIVDHLGESEKWKNLAGLRYSDYLDRNDFIEQLEQGRFDTSAKTLFHMGACSATTELDADYLMENNVHYTSRIAAWQDRHRSCRLIYASSAATYGDGSHGYSDNHDMLDKLRPLNMYGYSKHLFDCQALKRGWLSRIAGLKFFNVFGPNENHKNEMRSVIAKMFPRIRDEKVISLFASDRPDYHNGEQKRDFIYVKDVVDMILFFMDNINANGIFNIGTGLARTWNDVARSMFSAADIVPRIEYQELPAVLKGKYQYYTCADMSKLRAAGCTHECRSLESAVLDYVKQYLIPDARLDCNESQLN